MKKISCMRWFIQLIRRDMAQYEENADAKQEVYKAARDKKNSKCTKILNKFK